ncbi:class I SAM-dependent methyltransferase [Thiotrichales bacterium 19S3-7]|nr:class I SAM-dependent methyltransferase [Thiotrichales bacterium 19S3-7]MCF6801088.1 class I SAM-dependent methyltransferase [Thiotrichales bacterium 19S3-11]
MSLSEFYQSERLLLDKLTKEVVAKVCLIIGSSDRSLLASTNEQFIYTGSFFHNQQNPTDGIFSPEHLPFKENTLDLLVLYHVFPMFKFPGKVLQEAFFSLKEGGRLVISHANPKNIIAEEAVIKQFREQGVAAEQLVYHHHSLRRVTESLKLQGFSYVNIEALVPDNALKRLFCSLLPQLVLGWLIVYEKQAIPLTPFGERERVEVLKNKYIVNAATMNQYKEK